MSTTTTTLAPSFSTGATSHATRETLRISLERVGFSIDDVEVLYNWKNLVSYSGSAPNYLFNNSKTLSDTFIDEINQTGPSTRANIGINKGTTTNAISSSVGYGTFSGGDLVKLSEDKELDDWTALINIESLCTTDASKRNIIFNNTGSTASSGFKIGINGIKNLFFEFYNTNGDLEIHTLQKVLNPKSMIAVSYQRESKQAKIYVYDPLSLTSTSKTINSSYSMEKGDEWYLGGLKTIPSASDFDQMFSGRIYEFILLKNVVGETEVKSIFDSMICSSITEDSISTVSETYYPPVSSVIQQVPTGNQILTGYTNTPTTITDASGTSYVFYEETPVYVAETKAQAVYTTSSTPSTRSVEQFTAGVKTFDYTYIKSFAPSSLILKEVDGVTSYNYQIHTHNKYSTDLNNSTTFNSVDGSFILKEDYESSKAIYIYVNGLLLESGADYTRDGIKIKKYSGSWTEDDVCFYDIVDNGENHFVDYNPSSGNLTISAMAGKDAYLDGKKLVSGTDFTDSSSDLVIDSSQVTDSGRIGVISRHSELDQALTGTMKVFVDLVPNHLISEILWLDGVRKAESDYIATNSCNIATSSNVVSKKSTVIYENQTTSYNI